jgi:molecular chaperone DnaK
VLRIINEPTAASLAYGLDKKPRTRRSSCSTSAAARSTCRCSRSATACSRSSPPTATPASAATTGTSASSTGWSKVQGDTASTCPRTHGLQRLKEAAEKAKIELSSGGQQTEINLPFITATDDGPLHLRRDADPLEVPADDRRPASSAPAPLRAGGQGRRVTKGEIDHIILVGGSTRMPAVQELVKELAGKEPQQGRQPRRGRRLGAAVQAGVLKGDVKDILLLDVTPLTLGIETKGGVMTKMIERNTTIPTRRRRSSPPLPTTSPRSRSTCCRASGRWPQTTRRSAVSSSRPRRPRPGACRRSR